MKFYLQFGHGMMEMTRELLSQWGGGSVILSPRDLNLSQLQKLAGDVNEIDEGHVLVDPQFYLPHTEHKRLKEQSYWPKDYETDGFWSGPKLSELLDGLQRLNADLGCSEFILPGLYADHVDSAWLTMQRAVASESARLAGDNFIRYATIALGSEAVRSSDEIHEVLEASEEWAIDGVYIVLVHPGSEYFSSDPAWLSNALDLIAGFRLRGKKTILGYANQQMLAAACAASNAIASGTWLNVRTFFPSKFDVANEEEIKRKAIWFYCPKSLSEFKLPFLDMAKMRGVLPLMAQEPPFDASSKVLFGKAQPSASGFGQKESFTHYLNCFRAQVLNSSQASFEATTHNHLQAIESATDLIKTLKEVGIIGQARDFSEAADVGRAALLYLQDVRGAQLSRKWHSLLF